MNLKEFGFGLAAATVMTTGALIAPAPAEAFTVTGNITFSGQQATIPTFTTPGQTGNVTFGSVTSIDNATGSFAATTPAIGTSGISVNSLPLTFFGAIPDPFEPTTQYQISIGSSVNPFVNFGLRTIGSITDTLTFSLNAGLYAAALENGALTLSKPIAGVFNFGGTTAGTGTLTAFQQTTSGYTIQLNGAPIPPTPVPTPALIPSLIGVGAAALRKRKKQEAEEAELAGAKA